MYRDDKPDIEGQVTFISADSGGRKAPIFQGYRPQFFYDDCDWDAVQLYPDAEQVNPGDTVRVLFCFTRPAAHVNKLWPGKMFLIREGARTIGYGQVTKLLNLEANATLGNK